MFKYLFIALLLVHTATCAANTFPQNTLFTFLPTADPQFCNPDSLVGTDCGMGGMYFTTKGDVIQWVLCNGMDTTTYQYGTYELTSTGISCIFTKEYSYYSGCLECPAELNKPVNPNSGRTTNIKPRTLQVEKISCKKFPYFFPEPRPEGGYPDGMMITTGYVFQEEKDASHFLKEIAGIKALSRFVK
jgi:hypothetical protein